MDSFFVKTNNIKLHYRDSKTENPPLLLTHGLTANCHAFDGLLHEKLATKYRVIIPDLRGRGQSQKPAFGYSMQEHALDIIGLLKELKLEKVYFVGHSFGGLLGMYMAAKFPNYIQKLVVIDAAAKMNPRAVEMLSFAVGRLDKRYKNFEEYLDEVKKAPYLSIWDDAMLSYFKADVMPTYKEGVTPISNIANIMECSMGVATTPWESIIKNIEQQTLIINGLDAYTLNMPLLPEEKAKETVALLQHGHYIATEGNHITMLYAKGAKQVVSAIKDFINEKN